MTNHDIEETKEAVEKVEKKYGKSRQKARQFLQKMGYLTKKGNVSAAYAPAKKKTDAA